MTANSQSISFSVPPALESELDALAARYPEKRSASLMFLHAIQEHFGFVPDAAVEWVAAKLGLQPINVFELVTFYPMFRRERIGRTQIKICRTLSCALAGAYELRDHFCSKLGLDAARHGPQTTPDGRFTVEFVECLASCGTAPVVMVNEELLEKVTTTEADQLITQGQE